MEMQINADQGIANAIESVNNSSRTQYLHNFVPNVFPETSKTIMTLNRQFATVPQDQAPSGEIEYHPFADAFPLMTEPELAEFAGNLKVMGLRRSIVLYEDKILDGRNRHRACMLNGEVPHFELFLGTPDEALDFVESENLYRRNMTLSQRAITAARLANLRQGIRKAIAPKAEQASNTQICVSQSQADVAKRFNVSLRSVSSAAKILKKGIPEVIEKVESGEMSINKAALVTTLSPKKQKQWIVRGREAEKRTISELKHKSLKALEGFEGLFYFSPEFNWSDPDQISGMLQYVQAQARQYASTHKSTNYAGIFEDAIFELEETKLSSQKLDDAEKIFAIIDHGTEQGESGIVERSDLMRLSRLSKERFTVVMTDLLEHKRIGLKEVPVKHDKARGATKVLVFRIIEAKPKRIETDEPREVYYDRW